MITGTIRPPTTDTPAHTKEHIHKIVTDAQHELDELLAHKHHFTTDTLQKLTIEKRFIKIRHIYYRVFNTILQGFKNDNKSVGLFEQQLLDRNYFRREKLQKNRN